MAGKRKTSRRKSAKISKKTFKFNPKKDKKLIIMLLVGFLLLAEWLAPWRKIPLY